MISALSNFVVNTIFNIAPFKRTTERPLIKPIEPYSKRVQWERGVEINVVAVAEVQFKKAYVISASRPQIITDDFNVYIEKKLVPLDLFIGWGQMSSPLSSRMLDYEKYYAADGTRIVYYSGDHYKLSQAVGQCAHVHFMTTSDQEMPKPGDCISFNGHLVDIYIGGELTWPTDLNMGDERCETVLPEKFEILRS